MNKNQRAIGISKETLEVVNSFSWLFMDAMWMLEYIQEAHFFITPTLITGFYLILKETGFSSKAIALSAFMWSFMNSIWLLGETGILDSYLPLAKSCFFIGIGCLIVGLFFSKDIKKDVALFRRFKVNKANL